MSAAGREGFIVIGHRGAAAHAPENTVVSLRAGVAAGADAIEFDVGLSRDGRAVVLHDTTLDRTTDGRGPLDRAAWDDIATCDAGSWFAARFAGERVPDLDAALAVVRGRVPVIVEIKGTSTDPARPSPAERRLLDEVLAVLDRTGGLAGATVSSSRWPVLTLAARRAPGLDLALTVGFRERRDPIAWAARIGATALHPNRRLCSPRWVARAHAAGLRVIPYTVNTAAELDRSRAAGADGVFTDDPARLRRLLDRRRPRPLVTGDLLLGIDQGSGGTRAVLVDQGGTLVASNEVRVASRPGPDGSIVQDADAIAASIARAAGPLLAQASRVVRGAGLAVQRSSIVIWRRADGRAVTPVISWRPGAAITIPDAIRRNEETIARRTGLTARFPYGAIRVAALAAEHPALALGLARGELRAGPLGAFLAARLADPDAAVDRSLGQRMLLLDAETLAWSETLADLLGVPVDALPRLDRSTTGRGALRLGRRRVPLRALAGDVGAAARACLVDDDTAGLIVLGTGGFVVVPTGSERVQVDGLLASILYDGVAGPRWAVEGTVHGVAANLIEAARAGSLGWREPDLIASRAGPARRAPRIVPAVEGLGTPDWDLAPRFAIEPGAWSGDEIARGTVEGLAERFGRIADRLRAAGRLPARFVAAGGLAFAPHLVQAIASRTGVPIGVDPRPQRTACGAALLAGDAGAS